MSRYRGKFMELQPEEKKGLPLLFVFSSFLLVELFGLIFLMPDGEKETYPLLFGLLWSGILTALVYLLPGRISRIFYGITYFLTAVYAGFQTGYYLLFSEMMWLSDFRYASEGADYADMLLTYPAGWWLGIIGMIGQGILLLWKFPVVKRTALKLILSCAVLAASFAGMDVLPEMIFEADDKIKYAGSDYGRSQSAEAVYENMFNTHRLYRICGLHHTLAKDIYKDVIYPLTPSHAREQDQAEDTIRAYFEAREDTTANAMTGKLAGKNVVLVLMESMDDWMIGEHTPTLKKLMGEGINFTRFYTPVFGGIRTFNSEFAVNTGSFLSSQGGYAFDYVTNAYPQSLANRLREAGYSAKTFHYNAPTFYSRGEFSPAMGYEEYVCYADYVTEADEKAKNNLLYDDLLLFESDALSAEFFREGQPNLNFVITRSAHLSYKYNEVLSHWGLKKYPEYRGLTGNEETDCAYLKAKLVDDMFARLLKELEEKGVAYELSVKAHVFALFVKLFRNHVRSRTTFRQMVDNIERYERIKPVLEYMRQNISEPIRLEALAKQCSVSSAHFCRLFRQITGTTPGQYLTTLRLHQAAALLRRTDRSISQIAAEVGFDDVGYMSRCFKKQFGMTPTQVKRQALH